MKASLKNLPQSPRKVRLVTDLVKGKRAKDAIAQLTFLPKRAGEPIRKLIESAVANAKQKGESIDNLHVKNIVVNAAQVLKRMRPRAMGRGAVIKKRFSKVEVELSQK